MKVANMTKNGDRGSCICRKSEEKFVPVRNNNHESRDFFSILQVILKPQVFNSPVV